MTDISDHDKEVCMKAVQMMAECGIDAKIGVVCATIVHIASVLGTSPADIIQLVNDNICIFNALGYEAIEALEKQPECDECYLFQKEVTDAPKQEIVKCGDCVYYSRIDMLCIRPTEVAGVFTLENEWCKYGKRRTSDE